VINDNESTESPLINIATLTKSLTSYPINS